MAEHFSSDLCNDIGNLFSSGYDYDVIIQAGEGQNMKELFTHSLILGARSIYFKAAFSKKWAKKENGYIARVAVNFQAFAIYNRLDIGPAFGGGWNLGIQSNIMSKCNGYTYPEVDNIFADKNNIKKNVFDYEVFQQIALLNDCVIPICYTMSGHHHTDKDVFFVDSSASIKIEVLHYPPANIISNYPPILFIHGSNLAAWAWENFCHWFSNKGHDCYAMSFRGHGQSTKTPNKDKWWSLSEITNDISVVTDAIIARTGDKPVLVGHSFGGGFLQNYLKNNHQKVTCGVLFASSSPYSYKSITFVNGCKTFLSHPIIPILKALFNLNTYALIETPKLMKRAFFSKAFPDSMAREIHPKLEKFSFIKGAIIKLNKPFVDPSRIKCPMIVIGAEEDKVFIDNLKNVSEIAKAYGVGFDIIKGAAHHIMLDLTWEDAANVIFDRIHEKIWERKN
ncbi:13666_t:CDS:2 [Funneliformis geosporum]|uniref:13666_t:CDS:1 n=1 Tax=Funneliformis geosporum TaxID=1117311 RepID=A0A9W4S9S8_9GLOM|nr:13666_t:CDS:2 [Funneliformis geosporum]